MRYWTILRLRLRSISQRSRIERELEEELRFGGECAGEGAITAGADAVREACRDQRGVAAIENLVTDARRALRRLVAAPGFALTAVVALGFGVAAATAMFSLCDAVLLRPMPGIADGHGLVHLENYDAHELLGNFSYPDYDDYRALSRSYSGLAAASNFDFDVAGSTGTETLHGELVSGNYFTMLGVRAELGRMLLPGDESPGANRVVVISDRYWRSRLSADPLVVGRSLETNHTLLTIVGVAGPGFQGTFQLWSVDLWLPVTTQPILAPMGSAANDCLTSRYCGWITILGRLAPGSKLARAQAEADTIAGRIAAAHPEIKQRHAVVVSGLGAWSDDRANQARFLGLLLAGTLLLVAMTSVSLGSLFLARMGARQHEVATQLALGAGRGRVARQFLLEAGWVAVAGAGLGGVAAGPVGGWLLRLSPNAPENLSVAADWRVLAFAAGLAGLSALAMALVPALLAARRGRLGPALQQGGRGASAVRHHAQRALLALQVGLALVLLIAAGLAGRTLRTATAGQVPSGADHTVLAQLDTGHASYSRPQVAAFYDRLRRGLAAEPGFTAVALTSCLVPAPCDNGPVFLAGTEPSQAVVRANEFQGAYPRPDISRVSPEFFHAFGLPLISGRLLTAADRPGAPLVCVINQRLAERLWPHQSALGRRLAWPQYSWTGDHDFTVVGVVANRRSESLLQAPPMAMYVAAADLALPRMWIAVQTSQPQAAVLARVRAQVAGLDSRLPVINGRTLAEQVRRSLWQPLAIASLAGLFGLLAALLAAVGLFGTLAQLVHERRREMGVRLALGATPRALVGLVVRDGLRSIAFGLLSGLAAAALLAPRLSPWLFGISARDPLAWMAAAALLAAVALLAAYCAARRAARLSPMESLRCE